MICMYKGDDYEGQRKGVLLSAAVFLHKVTGGMLTLGDNQFVFKPVQDETVLKGILEPRDIFLELFVRRV